MSGRVAIVDYGMGNLFSVQSACDMVGVPAEVTSDPHTVAAAPGVVLPGVGAFGDAVDLLRRTGLASALRDAIDSGAPVLAVCLGLQLLARTSEEFGLHEGLGVISADVVAFPSRTPDGQRVKVPHVGWAPVRPTGDRAWKTTPLSAASPGTHFYFVHSYRVVADPAIVVGVSTYAGIDFCAAVAFGRVLGCQFHPERSGPVGLMVYKNMFGLTQEETE